MRGHGPVLGIAHSSRVFQFSAYTFDVSMGEIWTTLTTGATLCVPSEHERMNDLAGAIRRLEATWVFLTPTVASHVDPEKVGQVKTLVYGGEAASRENIFSWADRLCLVNSYGPAESSIWASAAVGVSNSHSSKNIGYPVRCALWVTEPGRRDKLLQLGSIGELVIEGPNVALGYFKNEAKTKEAFLQNPVWGRQEGEKPRRCYCSGDLVRLRTDGAVEFMGRKYTQIKLRSLRIELGEIEHQMRNFLNEDVNVTVEMVNPAEGTASRALAGSICLEIDETASTLVPTRLPDAWETLISRLRSYLEAHVPYHMVPSVFVPLCRMPLTGTGKTDRKALRQLIAGLTLQEFADFSNNNCARHPPKTDVQCLLRDIWCSVIGLSPDSICLEDHWFRSGGDSVLAMRFSQLARDKGLSLSANDPFQNPILENLAAIAAKAKQNPSVHEEMQPLPPFALLSHTELGDLKVEVEKVYSIDPSNVEDMYPCSPLQEGLMALSMKVGNTYVAQFAFDVPDTLDVAKLRAAWKQVTEENAILRTSFVHTSLGTIQAVMKDEFHWQHITGETTEEFLMKNKQLPVRYGKPLNRYALLQDGKKTTFVWTSHHALYDGVSVSRLLESVEAAYHERNTLVSQPYNLFMHYLRNRDKGASQSYWRDQLGGSRNSSLFSKSHHAAPRPTSELRRTVYMPSRRGAEITQASILRAAWALLVARYSSSVDVIFGSTVSGRTASLPGIDLVSGPTVATLPIRAQVNPQQHVRDFLRSVHQNATDMVPFEQDGLQYIREWCPDAATALEFENLFIVQMPADRLSGNSFLEMKPIPVDLSHFYSYPINVECTVQHDGVEVLVHYDPAIMHSRQMDRLISQFGHVVQELSDSDDQRRLCDVQMVSPEDMDLLREWNAFIPSPFRTTLHDAVGEVAVRYPDRTAVVTQEESMSYQEMEYQSSKLAQSLVGSSVAVGERVLLAYGKSRAAIIAIMAVLKAGGTAVPINPKHPESRLRSIVNEAGASAALCTEQYRELVTGLVENVNVFDTEDDISSTSTSLPKVSPTDVAFLYFTGGSTGIPKGVILEHGQLGASLIGQVDAWDVQPESRVLQFASLAYDAFVAEAFGAFFAGACLCMPSEPQCMNELTGACDKLQVTLACLTVTVARTLRLNEIRTLDKLIVGGEPLSRGDLENWTRHTQLHGIYGITETSLWCSQTERLEATSCAAQLGRPFSGAFWVVDPQDSNQLVPIGALSELLIESPAIARGYLFEHDQAQSAFLGTPPFLQALFPGRSERVYRTGDLVRYNANHLLEYVARKDSIVKINGQRIDLAEIENSLKILLPVSVEGAVQVVDQADRTFLAAFLTSRRREETSACELEQDGSASNCITSLGFQLFGKLAAHLPRHAVPSVAIPITRLPTLLSGKLDRKQLKTFAARISGSDIVRFQRTVGVAHRPSTEAGQMMAQIWAELLGCPEESLSIEDHFLRMGGDSVKAMRLVSMLYQKGYILTVDQVFHQPTLGEMISSMQACSETGDQSTDEQDGSKDATKSAGTLLKYMLEATGQCDCDISDIDDVYPTTPVQEALMTSSNDGTGTFVVHLAWKLPSNVDPRRLQTSIISVIQDSSIWRTRFFYADGVLMQCVLRRPDPVLFVLQTEDFNWDCHMNEESKKPMGLGDPMIRFSIVGDSKAQYLTMKAHHSVYDGWMIPQMFDNFEHSYLGEPLSPTVPFRRFVSYVQSRNKARSEYYWKRTLDGGLVPDFPEYPHSDYRPLTSARMIRRLPTAKPTAGFTISTVLRAAWAFLLGQYTSSQDVSFGVTTTGRAAPLSQIDKVNGPCISTTPARVCFDLDQTIDSYLEKVQKEGIAAVPHEQIGLQVLRRISSDCASCCNLRTVIVVQTGHIRGGGRLGLEEVDIDERQSHPCAINLQCIFEGEQMTLDANYDGYLLDSRQMNRILRQLEYLVAKLSSASSFTRLRDLFAINPGDRAEIKQWNSEIPPLQNSLMHSLVGERVKATPTKVAIDAWDGRLTYQQYDQLATNLAHFLAEQYKVVPDQIIPLHFEKSKWTAVAMYAVLKAGGAYAFIGLQEPPHRITSMVQTTKARLALASASQAQKLSEYVENVLAVSPELMRSLPNQSQSVQASATPENVAYVLFTSGSTGEPKAALTEHRAGSTSAIEHGTVEEVHSGCRILQFASYSFDVSTSETFTTLIKGGTVCIPSEEDRLNNLAEVLNRFEVNHTFLTPTVVSLIKPDDVPKLKTLKLGGEALTRDNVAIWADKVKLSNSYGVAECAIRSVFRNDIKPDTDFTNCGWAVGGCVWITSPEDAEQLVPIGAVGELLVEGPTVAREYLGAPEKTAKSFVSPSWLKGLYPERPCRVYRTGDLVKYAADGSIRFVGRSDSQVKINGQRCELREIEHHLCVSAESGLGAAAVPPSGPYRGQLVAVVAINDGLSQGGKLALYTTKPRQQLATSMTELSTILEDRVPPYMVPSIWIPVNKLAINPSGKLDRISINRWLTTFSTEDQQFIRKISTGEQPDDEQQLNTPFSATESLLRDIWARVLNYSPEQIVPATSFFRIGGDSISAMQVAALCQGNQLRITMQDIMRNRTLHQLATCCDSRQKDAPAEQPLHKERWNESFLLGPIQSMFFDLVPEGTNLYDQGFYLRLRVRVSVEAVMKAFRAVVQRHSMLRATFQKDGCQWIQKISPPSEGSQRFRAYSVPDDQCRVRQIIRNTRGQLNIEKGPVFVGALIDQPDQGQTLFLTAHHLVVDLISWRVILRDIEDHVLMRKLLPIISMPYQPWLQQQWQHAIENQSSVFIPRPQSEFDYWAVPLDQNTFGNVTEQSLTLDERATAYIFGEDLPKHRLDPVDVLLGALSFSFGQVFHDRPLITIENEGHGREPWDPAIDLSQTVGWFATRYPVCVGSQYLTDLVNAIRRTRQIRQSAVDNGRELFTATYYDTANGRAFEKNAVAEICFNFLGQYQQLESEDALFHNLGDPCPERDSSMPRFALLEMDALVEKGCLTFNYEYPVMIQHQERLQQWFVLFLGTLESLSISLESSPPEPTLSDFPRLQLAEADFEAMIEKSLPAAGIPTARLVEDIYPCSPTQHGIFLSQLRDPHRYNVVMYFRVEPLPGFDAISNEKLQGAWEAVVARHSSLRTIILDTMSDHGSLLQVVLSHKAPTTLLLHTATESDAMDMLRAQADQTKIESQPLHTLTICTTSAEGSALCKLEISHALIDGASNSILFSDLEKAYANSLAQDSNSALSSYSSQIHLTSREDSLRHWSEYLSGVEACIFPHLNTDTSESTDSFEIEAPSVDIAALRRFCGRQEITVFTIYQLAWAMVLRMFTGDTSTCFGFLASDRDLEIPGIQDSIGPYINLLVSRVDVGMEESIGETLRRLQKRTLEGLDHRFISLSDIYHTLGINDGALFNTVLSVQRGITEAAQGKTDCTTSVLEIVDPTEFDITVNVLDTLEDHQVVLTIKMAAVPKYFAERLAHTLTQTVNSIISTGQNYILSHVQTISPFDLDQILHWNNREQITVLRCVHDLIQESMVSHSTATAVSAWDGDFTYEELDSLSSKGAAVLMSNGIEPETFVPFCFEKTRWTVVAILSIMRAGGVCVPLEPSHPHERREVIINQLRPPVILVSQKHISTCEGMANELVVLGDTYRPQLEATGGQIATVRPSSAVYIIFTSGSTGVPKGVVWDHATLTSSILAHGNRLQMTRRTRILQFASHVFDVSVSELVSPLVYGKTIVIPSDETRLHGLEQFVTDKEVDWAFLTPTMARVMDPDQVPTLKTLLLGGEPIGQDNVDKWSQRLQMVITWGPCETCIYSACRIVTDSALPAENFGHAIGSSHWIVERDNASRLLPVGAVGEIVTSGPIVARGYLNNEAETARAFIGPQSWSPKPNESVPARYYKTGDLGRYNMDGSISFVARKDNQIKIRGQRMELHDVEQHLAKLPTVAHAMIGFPKEGPAAKQLVAVVSFKDECIAQISPGPMALLPPSEQVTRLLYQLKDGLSSCLPTWMVPRIWIPVQLLPRTSNGKIDRVRIRGWIEKMSDGVLETVSGYYQGKQGSPPATEDEKTIQSVLAEALNIAPTQIFRDSSFIRLGGDSITAMTVMSKCRRIGIILSVQDILKCKSLESLASCAKLTSEVVTHSRPEQVNVPFPLGPIQRMHLARMQTGKEQFNQGFYLTVTRDISPDRFEGALEALIQRHCALRTRFRRTAGGEWEQLIQAPSQSGYLLRVVHESCHQERQEIISEINSQIDLVSGSLVAVVLFMPKEGDDNQRLFITAHHLVVDLVSWRIILEELEEYLRTGQMSGHQSTNWPTWLSIQAQQISTVEEPVVSPMSTADFSFWGLAVLDNGYGDVIEEAFTLPADETTRLLQDVHGAFRTEPVDCLLAATICGFMQAFPERIDIPTFYNEGHGREPRDPSVDLSRTVGWFTSMFPLAFPKDSPRDLLSILVRVKDARRVFAGSKGTDFFALNHPMASALEILFNYSGIYQQLETKTALFTRAEPMDPMGVDPALPRFSLFAIETVIEHGELTFTLGYPRKVQRQSQISDWVAQTQDSLLRMIQKLPLIAPRLTLGDLSPNAGIKYSDLDHLINQILPGLGILRDDVEDFVACAPIQSYQLNLERRKPGSLNSSFCFQINPSQGGPVEYGRLQRAWQMVVDRNASLRTIFVRSSDGKDMQLVLKNVTISVGQYCWDDSVSPAAIMTSPPNPYPNGKVHSELAFYQAADSHSFCFLDLSHALSDAGSRDPLFLELAAAYDECSPSWAPRSFISAALERDSINQESYQFWQNYLTGVWPSNVSVVHDPAKPGYGHGDIVVTAPSYAGLKSRCASRGVTVSSFLYTAWMLLLSNETGQNNVCFNYITSGRDPRIADIDTVIGPCFNLHVAIAKIQPQNSLDQVLETVSDDFLTTLAHHAVSMTGLNRPEFSEELCNTMVNFRKFNPVSCRPPPEMTMIKAFDQSGQLAHALCLDAEERNNELYVVICYKRQQIAHQRATEVGQRLERILDMLIAEPEAEVKDLMAKLG